MRRVKNSYITAYLAVVFLHFLYTTVSAANPAEPGSWQTKEYFPLISGKKIGVVANHTSTIGRVHLVDSLIHAGHTIQRIFAPEHGFRGNAANGETVADGKDVITGLPVVSLYGSKLKPTPADLQGIETVVFDIQDVGVRFYTYLATMHYVMEACAESGIPMIVLDRPNPNGYYVDGPILDTALRSIVGMHPIPLVHGMTLGELAGMINGQGWLRNGATCSLRVIKIQNWDHNTRYDLPIGPSPNLQSRESIILYPTMGLFEGTIVSMGRGTPYPFECFGAPWLKEGRFTFVPQNIPGKAMNPPFLNDTCHGFLVTDFARNYLVDHRRLYIEWLELLLQHCPDREKFFNNFFDKLAGTRQLRLDLLNHVPLKTIRAGWEPGIKAFLELRKPYLLYAVDPDSGLRISGAN